MSNDALTFGSLYKQGLWTRFFPAIVKLQELLAANHIGQIKMVSGTFGLPMVQERVHLKGIKCHLIIT